MATEDQLLHDVSEFRTQSHYLTKLTGFTQGTTNDCLSIHLSLGQASVSHIGITLATRKLLKLGLGGVCKQSVVVLLSYGTDRGVGK
jgi:hypothetical protein